MIPIGIKRNPPIIAPVSEIKSPRKTPIQKPKNPPSKGKRAVRFILLLEKKMVRIVKKMIRTIPIRQPSPISPKKSNNMLGFYPRRCIPVMAR
jgi:hypothetical protein